MSAAADPIGSAQAHLVDFLKLVADVMWAAQQLSAPDPKRAAALGARLAASADELERLVRAIPDYAAIAGPRDEVTARLRAGEAEQDALAAGLAQSIAAGGARSAAHVRVRTRKRLVALTQPPPLLLPRAEAALAAADADARVALAAACASDSDEDDD